MLPVNSADLFSGFRRRHSVARRDLEETGRHVVAAARPQRRHHDHQQQRLQRAPSRGPERKPKVGKIERLPFVLTYLNLPTGALAHTELSRVIQGFLTSR